MASRKVAPTHSGNCWEDAAAYFCKTCGDGTLCDVCHKHDMPRGECSKCPNSCPACALARLSRAGRAKGEP